jgi:DtxR family Mn-dependent transcriptional regulator
MSDLIDTTEMYLRTLFELSEEGIPPLRARIAERLGQSGPTVSQTVARMERDGLVHVREDRSVAFTPTGQAMAVRVMRKHRLAECLLVDVIGLPWAQVHDEACRWEHVMGDDVERRLVELLDHPELSPFGNPIPGLAELGEPEPPAGDWRALSGQLSAEPRSVKVQRLAEHVQSDPEIMAALDAAGVRPGSVVTVQAAGREVAVCAPPADQVLLPRWAADLIVVEPVSADS